MISITFKPPFSRLLVGYTLFFWIAELQNKLLEMRGIEPRAFRMQSEHSTTELHPLH